jgi:hypothetical protein
MSKRYERIIAAWDAATAANATELANPDWPPRSPNSKEFKPFMRIFMRIIYAVQDEIPDLAGPNEIREALEWRKGQTGEEVGFIFPLH